MMKKLCPHREKMRTANYWKNSTGAPVGECETTIPVTAKKKTVRT